jgi:hypothetical protein
VLLADQGGVVPDRTQRVTRDWKYVRRFDDRTEPVRANGRRGCSSRSSCTTSCSLPYEMRNVVHEPRNAEIVGDLAARLEKWMRDTGDPLLDGPVPPPPGAEVNDPDQRSADDARTVVGGDA